MNNISASLALIVVGAAILVGSLLADVIGARRLDDWLETLEVAGVPCGPINTLDRVFANPQVRARGMLQEVDHPIAGCIPTVANPIRFSRTPVVQRTAAPVLGQHNDKLS